MTTAEKQWIRKEEAQGLVEANANKLAVGSIFSNLQHFVGAKDYIEGSEFNIPFLYRHKTFPAQQDKTFRVAEDGVIELKKNALETFLRDIGVLKEPIALRILKQKPKGFLNTADAQHLDRSTERYPMLKLAIVNAVTQNKSTLLPGQENEIAFEFKDNIFRCNFPKGSIVCYRVKEGGTRTAMAVSGSALEDAVQKLVLEHGEIPKRIRKFTDIVQQQGTRATEGEKKYLILTEALDLVQTQRQNKLRDIFHTARSALEKGCACKIPLSDGSFYTMAKDDITKTPHGKLAISFDALKACGIISERKLQEPKNQMYR